MVFLLHLFNNHRALAGGHCSILQTAEIAVTSSALLKPHATPSHSRTSQVYGDVARQKRKHLETGKWPRLNSHSNSFNQHRQSHMPRVQLPRPLSGDRDCSLTLGAHVHSRPKLYGLVAVHVDTGLYSVNGFYGYMRVALSP